MEDIEEKNIQHTVIMIVNHKNKAELALNYEFGFNKPKSVFFKIMSSPSIYEKFRLFHTSVFNIFPMCMCICMWWSFGMHIHVLLRINYFIFIYFRTRGIGFLYKGMEAKLLQTVLTAALMFAIYEKIANFIFKAMGLRW